MLPLAVLVKLVTQKVHHVQLGLLRWGPRTVPSGSKGIYQFHALLYQKVFADCVEDARRRAEVLDDI